MQFDRLAVESVLRVGEVTEVTGQRVSVQVDRKKNSTDLLFQGEVLRNISVGSFVEIRKGFLSLIGKVDGEKIDEALLDSRENPLSRTDRNRRYLYVSLVGYLDKDRRFRGGLRELPLIGNQVFLVTREQIEAIHDLTADDRTAVHFALTDNESFQISFPVDGLFNSHIAIFGNTGSGKSNTLARMYGEFIRTMEARNSAAFAQNVRIVLIDFNGEYCGADCLSQNKKIYRLATNVPVDRLPVPGDLLLNVEMLSILADATDKTQKPFIGRALRLHKWVYDLQANDSIGRFRNLLRSLVKRALQMSDKVRADLVLDYLTEIVPEKDGNGNPVDVRAGLEWHNVVAEFKFNYTVPPSQVLQTAFLKQDPAKIDSTPAYQSIDLIDLNEDALGVVIKLMYVQLIQDILTNRAQNDHIAPAINKLISKRKDVAKVFDFSEVDDFSDHSVVVVSLDAVNLEMKKTIPLLLAKWLYAEHKKQGNQKSLTLIIDEAHNILSSESFREAESWKDYRLETFEEIIKEGRKFGVFMTISSQRPNDISPTIVSQAHNYFIHRLVNQKDLAAISGAVSYIDKVSEGSIPTLPTGTCIFSGVAGQMPLKLRINPLPDAQQPRSATLKFDELVPEVVLQQV